MGTECQWGQTVTAIAVVIVVAFTVICRHCCRCCRHLYSTIHTISVSVMFTVNVYAIRTRSELSESDLRSISVKFNKPRTGNDDEDDDDEEEDDGDDISAQNEISMR